MKKRKRVYLNKRLFYIYTLYSVALYNIFAHIVKHGLHINAS